MTTMLPDIETPDAPESVDFLGAVPDLPRTVLPAPIPDPALRGRCPVTPADVHIRQRRAA